MRRSSASSWAPLSEGMGAVGADRVDELEQQLVGGLVLPEARVAVLGSDLAELARPVREDERAAPVAQARVLGPLGVVVAQAGEPAPPELVLQVTVAADGVPRG